MRDIQELLRAGAGEKDASFGVGDVFARSSVLRRRRLASIGTLGVLIVAAMVFVGSGGFDLSDSDREGMSPVAPDRREALVYSSQGDIFLMRGNGGPTNITNTPEEETNPAISPDGSTIVFERVEGPDSALNWALHSMPVEDGDMRRLTSGLRADGYDRAPAWSPDGSRLAFVRHFPKGSEIVGTDTTLMVIEPDGSGEQELADEPAATDGPSWSKDGTVVFFGAQRGDRPWVIRVDIAEGQPTFVAEGGSPQALDADSVAFLRVLGPRSSDLFAVEASGERERRLTRGRTFLDLVAFGDGGLAAVEAPPDAAGGDPRAASDIVILRGPNPWRGKLDNIIGLQGFSIWLRR